MNNAELEEKESLDVPERIRAEETEIDRSLPEAQKLVEEVDSRIVLNAIKDEEPSSLAVFLLKLPQKQAAKLLSQFPSAKRPKIAKAIAQTEIMSTSEVEEIYRNIAQKIYEASKNSTVFGDGTSNLASILKYMDAEEQSEILESLSASEPDITQKIRDGLFSFEDIVDLDDDAIRTILHVMDNSALGLAIKTADEKIKQRFFDCMTEEQIEQVQEAMENISVDQIHLADSARQAIVRAVQNFSEKGMLKIRRKLD